MIHNYSYGFGPDNQIFKSPKEGVMDITCNCIHNHKGLSLTVYAHILQTG